MNTPVNTSYDFVLLLDVQDGNPNGDPDNENAPRQYAEDGIGLISDKCLKRKIRNYAIEAIRQSEELQSSDRYHILFEDADTSLNHRRDVAVAHAQLPPPAPKKPARSGKGRGKAKAQQEEEGQAEDTQEGNGGGEETLAALQRKREVTRACNDYFWDTRMFGAVLSTGEGNVGLPVRGAAQITWARTLFPLQGVSRHCITRSAVTNDKDLAKARAMGAMYTVPYALYVAHGSVTFSDARDNGVTEEDLALFWESIQGMCDQDRASARGLMTVRKLIVFKHNKPLRRVPSAALYRCVKLESVAPEGEVPRSFDEYKVTVELPDQFQDKVELKQMSVNEYY